ncbi:MAG: C4-dicarboxylate TRAP transporter substrate-binding protein [Defluviitaleaceae bacterium]|nr:C4-dicarboxylate TRAP transporter substrate-binding protein [Defluviitaleaceae bacterium]
MLRKLTVILASFAVILAFAACASPAAPAAPAPAEAAAEPVLFQIGYENHPGEPIDLAVNEWARLIEERSGGSIRVELFPSSLLGSKNDLLDQMIAGAPVATLADGAFYAERGVPDFGIVFAPYLFATWEECWALTESDWYAEQTRLLAQNGLQLLASNWIYGQRHMLTTRPIHTPNDLAGFRMRVANSPTFIRGFEALGATPTPMALGEVYTALQQGVIDGVENPLPVLYNGGFHEVATYLLLSGHVRNFTTWVTGAPFFNSLTPEQQQILKETAYEAGLFNNGVFAGAEEAALEALVSHGVVVHVPTDEEVAAFQEAALRFFEFPDIVDRWTPGLAEYVISIIRS